MMKTRSSSRREAVGQDETGMKKVNEAHISRKKANRVFSDMFLNSIDLEANYWRTSSGVEGKPICDVQNGWVSKIKEGEFRIFNFWYRENVSYLTITFDWVLDQANDILVRYRIKGHTNQGVMRYSAFSPIDRESSSLDTRLTAPLFLEITTCLHPTNWTRTT